jgi:hypothetical protein
MADTVPAGGAAPAAAAAAGQPPPRQLRSFSLTPDVDDSKESPVDARAASAAAAAAAASAAAAVALRDLIAGAKGRPWSGLHSSEQVAVLGDDELCLPSQSVGASLAGNSSKRSWIPGKGATSLLASTDLV